MKSSMFAPGTMGVRTAVAGGGPSRFSLGRWSPSPRRAMGQRQLDTDDQRALDKLTQAELVVAGQLVSAGRRVARESKVVGIIADAMLALDRAFAAVGFSRPQSMFDGSLLAEEAEQMLGPLESSAKNHADTILAAVADRILAARPNVQVTYRDDTGAFVNAVSPEGTAETLEIVSLEAPGADLAEVLKFVDDNKAVITKLQKNGSMAGRLGNPGAMLVFLAILAAIVAVILGLVAILGGQRKSWERELLDKKVSNLQQDEEDIKAIERAEARITEIEVAGMATTPEGAEEIASLRAEIEARQAGTRARSIENEEIDKAVKASQEAGGVTEAIVREVLGALQPVFVALGILTGLGGLMWLLGGFKKD
jgi:hypothetical protein